jgi:hypothetical protein
MLRVEFKPQTPVFEGAETARALDPAATVSGRHGLNNNNVKL